MLALCIQLHQPGLLFSSQIRIGFSYGVSFVIVVVFWTSCVYDTSVNMKRVKEYIFGDVVGRKVRLCDSKAYSAVRQTQHLRISAFPYLLSWAIGTHWYPSTTLDHKHSGLLQVCSFLQNRKLNRA